MKQDAGPVAPGVLRSSKHDKAHALCEALEGNPRPVKGPAGPLPGNKGFIDKLQELVARWEHHARREFHAAESEENYMGRKLLEHGAVCHCNCAKALGEVLKAASTEPSATPEGDQK